MVRPPAATLISGCGGDHAVMLPDNCIDGVPGVLVIGFWPRPSSKRSPLVKFRGSFRDRQPREDEVRRMLLKGSHHPVDLLFRPSSGTVARGCPRVQRRLLHTPGGNGSGGVTVASFTVFVALLPELAHLHQHVSSFPPGTGSTS